MDFKLEKFPCIITSVNTRTEAAGENKRANLAKDLRVLAENMPAKTLQILQPTDPGVDVNAFTAFFTKDGTPRFRSIDKVLFDYDIKNCTVLIAGQEFLAAKASKFKAVKFRDDGKVDIAFRLQVHPTPQQSGVLDAQLTATTTELSLNPAQQELPLDDEGGQVPDEDD